MSPLALEVQWAGDTTGLIAERGVADLPKEVGTYLPG